MKRPQAYAASPPIGRGLTRKFIATLVFGVALGIFCTAVFSYYHASALREENAGVEMRNVAELVAEQIDLTLDASMQSLAQLAASEEIRQSVLDVNKQYKGLLPAEVSDMVRQEFEIWKASRQPRAKVDLLKENPASRALAAFASANPGYSFLRVVCHTGTTDIVAAAYGPLEAPYSVQEQWWRHADVSASGKPAVREPEGTVVSICVPVTSGEAGALDGKLVAEYNLDATVPRLRANAGETLAFVLGTGSDRRMRVLAPSSLASAENVEFREKSGSVTPRTTGYSVLTLGPERMTAIAGFAPVKLSLNAARATYRGRDWAVVAATPEAEAIGPINSLFVRALGFSAVMLLLVSLAGVAFARRILGPLLILQEGVQKIGEGNLEHRIDVRSGDEIEMLALEFNRMADRMQRTQEQLQRRSKELEQRVNQLRRLQAQLMQSERMAATGELAAQIAHEINNPLGIIKNYVGIARMLMPEEDQNRENMKIIDQEINRIAGIVRRLLKFAKPGTEEIQSVQINQILEELLALLRGQLFRRKIEIAPEFAENLPEVSASTDQLRQVFLNMIKNAEDAMPEGGKLTIRTRYRKGRVEIDIADDGCGIPPEDLKNIFEPFFTTKGVKGTGLGLSVSYGIIKNYSGEISVDSEPGRGTTFTIQLPVVSDKVFQVIQSS